jgi:hypothetical protein
MAHKSIDFTVINAIAFLVDPNGALIIGIVGKHLEFAMDDWMSLRPFPQADETLIMGKGCHGWQWRSLFLPFR